MSGGRPDSRRRDRPVPTSPRIGRYHPAVTPLVLVVAGLIAIGRRRDHAALVRAALSGSGACWRRPGGSPSRRPRRHRPRRSPAIRAGRGPDRRRRTNSRTPTTGRWSSAGRGWRPSNGGRWTAFEDSREAVPFEIREGLDSIGVDVGRAGRRARRRPTRVGRRRGRPGRPGTGDDGGRDAGPGARSSRSRRSSTRSSSASLCPGELDGDGPRLTAGLGRPLVLTTLEPAEAMRILAGGSTRPRLVAACFLVRGGAPRGGLAWAGLGAFVAAVVPVALAASPSPATRRRSSQQRRRSGPCR